MATVKSLLGEQGENAGELFHAGLRKGMDSSTSSLAWNIVHNMKPEVWGDFLKHVFNKLVEFDQITPASVRLACLSWETRYTRDGRRKEFNDEQAQDANTWHLMLELMTHQDWFSMAAWFVYCGEVEEGLTKARPKDTIGDWDADWLQYIARPDSHRRNLSWELKTHEGLVLAEINGYWRKDRYTWSMVVAGKHDNASSVVDPKEGITSGLAEVLKSFKLAHGNFGDDDPPKRKSDAPPKT